MLLLSSLISVEPSQSTIGFEWDAPDACPSPASVVERVQARLGATLSQGRSRRLDVIARVRSDHDRSWSLRVWFITDEGTRHRDLADESCELLADAAATLIAINIDSLSPRDVEAEVADESAPTQPEAIEVTKVSSEPSPRPMPAIAPPPNRLLFSPPQPSTWAELRAGGGAAYGPLPSFHGGPAVSLAITHRHLRLELGTSAWLGPPRAVGNYYRGEARFVLLAASVRAGYAWLWPRLDVSLTGGIEAGGMFASTRGLASSGRGSQPWFAVTVAPTLVVRPHPVVSFWFTAEGLGVPVRPRFLVENAGEVHRARAWGVRLLAGIGFVLGRRPTIFKRSSGRTGGQR